MRSYLLEKSKRVKRVKEGTYPFSGNRAEKRSHNLGKALGAGLGLLKTSLSSYTLRNSKQNKEGLYTVWNTACLSSFI